jgi:hypothetical protein
MWDDNTTLFVISETSIIRLGWKKFQKARGLDFLDGSKMVVDGVLRCTKTVITVHELNLIAYFSVYYQDFQRMKCVHFCIQVININHEDSSEKK